MIARADITGLILAGGMGRRMDGADKGLQLLHGRPLIAWSLERYTPQVGHVLVNANRHLDAYRGYGHPVISDAIAGYAGPLAGFQAGLRACATPYLAVVPCDTPFLPADLVTRLAAALDAAGADIAVARVGGRAQPVFMLMHVRVESDLERYVGAGGRKIETWYTALPHVMVDFDDEPGAFANLNSLDELRAAEKPCPSPGTSL